MKGFHGEVILPDDEGYDEVRKVFNGMVDRRPMLIARCLDTRDVVSVRGGGHSVADAMARDGGLMIDLSLTKGVTMDTVNRVAKAQPGLRLGEFIVERLRAGDGGDVESVR
jgi:hypothetical protein